MWVSLDPDEKRIYIYSLDATFIDMLIIPAEHLDEFPNYLSCERKNFLHILMEILNSLKESF